MGTTVSAEADEDDGRSGLVWHYTDSGGLKGMLDNRVLWASSAAYMNDFKELITGSDVLNKIYVEIREESSATDHDEIQRLVTDFIPPREENFILSATRESDSLTMWRYYGRDQVSFAVGLDSGAKLKVRAQSSKNKHPNPPADYYAGYRDDHGQLEENPDQDLQGVEPWRSMIYEEVRQRDLIRQALDELRGAIDASKGNDGKASIGVAFKKLHLVEKLYRIKHNGFRDEKEVRALAHAFPAWKYVIHRPGPYGMIPYVELGLPAKSESGARIDFDDRGKQKMEKLPIRKIKIGPTPYSAEAKFGLQQILSFGGYHDVEVTVSTIPYR